MKELWKVHLGLICKADNSLSKFRRKYYLFLCSVVEWIRRPLLCKIGLHKFSWNSFGINGKRPGEIYFPCYRCGDVRFYIPIDDLPSN